MSSQQMNQRSSSRPSTPHRLMSRQPIPQQSPKLHYPIEDNIPLSLEQFQELAESLNVLEDNLIKVNFINESIVKFNESFSSLLYGLLINSYCTEFTEAPSREDFSKNQDALDSVIDRMETEIKNLEEEERLEIEREKENTNQNKIGNNLIINNKRVTSNPINSTNSIRHDFKRPLTSATLNRLTKARNPSLLPSRAVGIKKNISGDSTTTTTTTTHLSTRFPQQERKNNSDFSYMSNDSFIENPKSIKNTFTPEFSNESRLKRKNEFGTRSGTTVKNNDANNSGNSSGNISSRIPVRKTFPKPAWK
ncbi:hypothetical protein PACTADRAFT_51141 [Pachysolen tannophilus NRRL Y-2460]|uniref:DASH complex subunit DAM1 n=1 Tax=Pachysolen tannophilus NRRL Y-2460 TaxID=669874 RepID=A0A1E4TRA2_PACTA|nr:hypothetical protein PACTADRAFT_51141 [Pachysolen tannophilus NRRL Y-2460]